MSLAGDFSAKQLLCGTEQRRFAGQVLFDPADVRLGCEVMINAPNALRDERIDTGKIWSGVEGFRVASPGVLSRGVADDREPRTTKKTYPRGGVPDMTLVMDRSRSHYLCTFRWTIAISLLWVGPNRVHAQGIYQDSKCYPMSAMVRDGYALSDDDKGPYVHSRDEARVMSLGAMSIFAWAHTDQNTNRPKPDATLPRVRSLVFDLSRPVPGSGSSNLGVIQDQLGRMHTFWKRDPEKKVIANFILTPVGETVTTDRVEMWVVVNGRQHVLQMGPWSMGEFSERAGVSGEGTTRATISRRANDKWTISAPRGSIARLSDYDNINKPIDKGLYYFDFEVQASMIQNGACT